MSECYESSGSSEKARYIVKLEAVSLTLEDDPYSKESGRNFEKNMTSWLPHEYGHIFGYFYHSPRFAYSRTAPILKAAIGYNYFQSNYMLDPCTCILGGLGMEEVYTMPLEGLCQS